MLSESDRALDQLSQLPGAVDRKDPVDFVLSVRMASALTPATGGGISGSGEFFLDIMGSPVVCFPAVDPHGIHELPVLSPLAFVITLRQYSYFLLHVKSFPHYLMYSTNVDVGEELYVGVWVCDKKIKRFL